MKRLKVLFADDQIPSLVDADNEQVFEQIELVEGDQLKKKGKDPRTAFNEDKQWFASLITQLSRNFDVIPARTVADAEARLLQPESFDIAIVDLSWAGDAKVLPPAERKNRGFKLLDDTHNARQRTEHKPVIVFSQNFKTSSVLMRDALRRGALPIPKDYARDEKGAYPGHDALEAALEFLADGSPTSLGQHVSLLDPDQLTMLQILRSMKPRHWVATLAIAVAVISAIATGAYQVGQALAKQETPAGKQR